MGVIDKTEDFMAEARERLARWGAEDWRQRQRGGFARETLEQSLRDYKFIPRATGMRAEAERPEVVEMDVIVSALSSIPGGDRYRLALWLWFAVRKTETLPSKDQDGNDRLDLMVEHEAGRLTESDCARLMQCSRATFRGWRDTGMTWVAGALAARESRRPGLPA